MRREKQNTRFIFNSLISKIVIRDNVKKYCRGGQVTDDSMAHALYVLDT
jgi:hypothetical protein